MIGVGVICSCCTPRKGNEYQLVYSTIREIQKVELGYVVVWEYYDGREFTEFLHDTAGCHYHIGSQRQVLIQR